MRRFWPRAELRWLGVVAGLVGFLGVLAGLFAVVVGRNSIPLLVFLMFGFMLVLGVRLAVRETREATAGKPQNGD